MPPLRLMGIVMANHEPPSSLRSAEKRGRFNREPEPFACVASCDLGQPPRMNAGYTQLAQLFQNQIGIAGGRAALDETNVLTGADYEKTSKLDEVPNGSLASLMKNRRLIEAE